MRNSGVRVKEVTFEARMAESTRSGRDKGAKCSLPVSDRAKMRDDSAEMAMEWAFAQSSLVWSS